MKLGRLDGPAYARFVSNIDNFGDGCWFWQGSRNRFGYGRFTWKRREAVAHRVAWEQWNGPIPGDLKVLHRCDNPPCVNPNHLFLGTKADNAADRDAKGRQASGLRNGAYTKPDRRVRGEAHGRHRFTADQVRDVRRRLSEGEAIASLAREYGVATTSIRAIKTRTNWAWLS